MPVPECLHPVMEKPADYIEVAQTPGLITDWSCGSLGQIFTRQEWEAWKADVDAFFSAQSDEAIEVYNCSRDYDSNHYYHETLGYFDKKEPKRKQAPPPPVPGYIYLIESEDGCYKIGRTLDMGVRFRGISNSLPYKTTLKHSFRSLNYIDRETELHGQYADKRLNGEWFRLDPADVEAICALTS